MAKDTLCVCRYESDLVGSLMLASNTRALIACHFEATANSVPVDSVLAPNRDRVLAQACAWLDRYFAGERPSPAELPLEPAGTPFQQRVWNLLREIPYGEVTTYGALAKRLSGDGRMSSQAVGQAVGRNPLGIIVPCHRVIGANGNLTGFGGGLAVKFALLEHEGLDTSTLRYPPHS